MKKAKTKVRFYLKEILKNAVNSEEFKRIFSESGTHEECVSRLRAFREKHQNIVGPVSGKKFILACFTRAREEDFDLSRVDGSRKAKIYQETPVVRKLFKKLWLAKEEVATMLAKLQGAGSMCIKNVHDLWNAATALSLPRRNDIAAGEINPPKFRKFILPDPLCLTVSEEAWQKPGARIAAFSRWDWKGKGARAGLVKIQVRLAVEAGCHYNVLNAGLVERRYIQARIAEALDRHDHSVSKKFRDEIIENILDEIAEELRSVIPMVRKPANILKKGDFEFVRLYITISPILDGPYGQRIAQKLEGLRKDVRVLKEGGDRTRLKGIGRDSEERRHGQEIEWLNPMKPRLPGQYASTSVDKEINEAKAAEGDPPAMVIVGGFGSSISKPGYGEKDRPYISLPIGSLPYSRLPGEPSIALNQIGMRIIETLPDGKRRRIATWSLRDLVQNERMFVTGIKTGATELQRKIVEKIKAAKHGLYIGELHDELDVDRDVLERAIRGLLESKALRRTTWPGLYKDLESGRYNFHRDWFQERLEYPWPYSKGFLELRRLIFGCVHVGYTTTDYEFVRWQFPKILLEEDIDVLELVGDIVSGLKHHLIHRGQIIGNMNYTEQEIFAAELLGTVIYDVFTSRFEKYIPTIKENPLELDARIEKALVKFLYIIGNHDAWQQENGNTPGSVFRLALYTTLAHYLKRFLMDNGCVSNKLESIVAAKIIELPENNAIYTYEGGLTTELRHPRMSRTKTVSTRAEEALDASNAHLVDIANFHTTIEVDKWHPEIGQRVATQAGTMVLSTDFEHGKLKIVDFGPVYSRVRYMPAISEKDGARIFFSEDEFFSEPIIKTPYSKNMDFRTLKDSLKLLKCPI